MPRQRLDLSEEERAERLKEQRRKSALKYYHAHNPSKHPRERLETIQEIKEVLERKKKYYSEYYQKNRDKILSKANEWNHTHKQITTVE